MATPLAPVTDYCVVADINCPDATTQQIQNGIDDATAEANSYLCIRYILPFLQIGRDLRGAVRRMARYYTYAERGFDPANPADQAIVKGYNDSVAWLKECVKPDGNAKLNGAIDSSGSPVADEATPIHSGPERHRWMWGARREEDEG